jgi:hypothetical protein
MEFLVKNHTLIVYFLVFLLSYGCKKEEKREGGSELKRVKPVLSKQIPVRKEQNRSLKSVEIVTVNNKLLNKSNNKTLDKLKKSQFSKEKIFLPSIPSPLKVKGFNAASHVAPNGKLKWPMPVIIVLHGNYDRPEWECDIWKKTAGYYGWILCPRGKLSPWASPGDDRWTYDTFENIRKEISSALISLENKYPGKVSRKGMVLAGFSLGANLAPRVAELSRGRYEYLFLVEGGVKKLKVSGVLSLKRSGIKGIVLAMGVRIQIKRAKTLLKILNRVKLPAVFINMKGAGHSYSDDFNKTGKAALKRIVGMD